MNFRMDLAQCCDFPKFCLPEVCRSLGSFVSSVGEGMQFLMPITKKVGCKVGVKMTQALGACLLLETAVY